MSEPQNLVKKFPPFLFTFGLVLISPVTYADSSTKEQLIYQTEFQIISWKCSTPSYHSSGMDDMKNH